MQASPRSHIWIRYKAFLFRHSLYLNSQHADHYLLTNSNIDNVMSTYVKRSNRRLQNDNAYVTTPEHIYN